MSASLLEVSVYHLVRLFGRSICSKNVFEDFWDVNFSCVRVEAMVVDSNMMNGFSANMLAILVYYLEVGDVGWGWLLETLCL